jgi:hypothetical protein
VARSEQNKTHSHKLGEDSAKVPPKNNFNLRCKVGRVVFWQVTPCSLVRNVINYV